MLVLKKVNEVPAFAGMTGHFFKREARIGLLRAAQFLPLIPTEVPSVLRRIKGALEGLKFHLPFSKDFFNFIKRPQIFTRHLYTYENGRST